LLDSNQQLTD